MSYEHLGALRQVASGATVSLLKFPVDIYEFQRLQPCIVYQLGEDAIVVSNVDKEGSAT